MKTIEVLGLGPSLKHYRPNGNETIGVNDIFREHRVDSLLVLDLPENFTPERFHVIVNSTPGRFYTSSDAYETMPGFTKVYPASRGGDPRYLDSELLPIHVDSTYSAVCLAYKLGAEMIIMHGVDLKDHPKLKTFWNQGIIQEAYKKLFFALAYRNCILVTGSQESSLAEIIPSININQNG